MTEAYCADDKQCSFFEGRCDELKCLDYTEAARPAGMGAMTEESTRFAAAVMDSRLCLRCASMKSDIVEERLVGVIRALQRYVTIEGIGECQSCGRRTYLQVRVVP